MTAADDFQDESIPRSNLEALLDDTADPGDALPLDPVPYHPPPQ